MLNAKIIKTAKYPSATKTISSFLFLILCFLTLFKTTSGHGRLIEPPSRASAWRYGFQTPPNYNDHELYCGGFARQWNKNGGKCGECGDAWDVTLPRPHEFGGRWGQGVVVRKYNPGGDITIRVELTASHMGYFEFRLCPEVKAKQDCLDKNVLKIVSGAPMLQMPNDLDTRFYPRNGSRIYEIKAKLPDDLKCEQCVIQWRYIAGNNWGTCADGTGMVGCGPQEEFRACADIAIGATGRTTIRPIRPGVKTTKKPTKTTDSKEPPLPGTSEDLPEPSPYVAPIIIAVTLLVVICILAAIYLYHYHGQRVKQLLRWKREKDSTNQVNPNSPDDKSLEVTNSKIQSNEKDTIDAPIPVPPPRTKRLSQSQSQVKDLTPDDLSVA